MLLPHSGFREGSASQRPLCEPSSNLHLEQQLGLGEQCAVSASPPHKRGAEPSLNDWQSHAQTLLRRPDQASLAFECCRYSHWAALFTLT